MQGAACAVLVAAVSTGCAGGRPRAADVSATLAAAPRATPSRPQTLPLPASDLERLLSTKPVELRSMKRAEGGVMGVEHGVAVFPGQGVEVPVKWKIAPRGDLDGWNNSPRKELAALAIERWFLDPDDWIVPPTAVRCLPLASYRRIDPGAQASVEGTQCVLGLIAAWLDHVSPAKVLYEENRFLSDRRYAYHMADLNLFTYLVEHRDGRGSNFLVADDEGDRRVYAVDNGIAFGNLVYNFLVPNWDVIRVPALRRAAVDRLRRLGKADLESLIVLTELRADAAGVLEPVAPGPALDRGQGVRLRPGVVQMGLTEDEVGGVADRLQRLLARIDAGEIPLF